MRRFVTLCVLAVLVVLGASHLGEAKTRIVKKPFGKTSTGVACDLYILKNSKGMEAAITNFGASLVSLKVADRKGSFADVVYGYDDCASYEAGQASIGGTVGRYANRIANGEFTLDGVKYKLPINDPPNTLHGGPSSFNKKVWQALDVSHGDTPALELTYVSPDGENGFPGNLTAQVTYTLTDQNELRIDYRATTDKDTVVNLTNHSYFNLAAKGDILQHNLTLHASRFTPVNDKLIPTGESRSVTGTPFDFMKPTAIGARIYADDQQMKFGRGYDHNWVIDGTPGNLRLAAEVYEPTTGRVLQVLTTEPGIQFYTGNFLDGSEKGKGGVAYNYRTALCLETQHFPDSPNHPAFPSTMLKPGGEYKTTTIFKFSVR